MKNPFQPGDTQIYKTQVTDEKLARFETGLVHPVYSTFALGRDAEWTCRLFVLEMLEPGEEGVGSYLSISHLSPAPLHAKVRIVATLESVNGREVVCNYEVFWGEKKIATGKQIQKIIRKSDFDRYLAD
ncbi:MAG: hypothetical protein R3C61_05030 [Bacteroidia bacterium]